MAPTKTTTTTKSSDLPLAVMYKTGDSPIVTTNFVRTRTAQGITYTKVKKSTSNAAKCLAKRFDRNQRKRIIEIAKWVDNVEKEQSSSLDDDKVIIGPITPTKAKPYAPRVNKRDVGAQCAAIATEEARHAVETPSSDEEIDVTDSVLEGPYAGWTREQLVAAIAGVKATLAILHSETADGKARSNPGENIKCGDALAKGPGGFKITMNATKKAKAACVTKMMAKGKKGRNGKVDKKAVLRFILN